VLPEELFPKATKKIEEIDKEDVVTLGRLILLSFTGFLVAGWFLSRAFAMTLFLLGGMAEVAYEMALQRGMIAPRMRLGKVAWYSLGLSIGLVLAMYVMLRIVNLIH
jgi:hypothetical protein